MESWIQKSNFMLFIINGLMKGEIEKPSGWYLGLISDESLTCRGLNSNLRHFVSLTFILCFLLENRVCLSHDVHVTDVV
jgi:hypothetical protein